ncbi:hypothetical protein VTN02DRAFT_278 [Thermoascus thermophilus]
MMNAFCSCAMIYASMRRVSKRRAFLKQDLPDMYLSHFDRDLSVSSTVAHTTMVRPWHQPRNLRLGNQMLPIVPDSSPHNPLLVKSWFSYSWMVVQHSMTHRIETLRVDMELWHPHVAGLSTIYLICSILHPSFRCHSRCIGHKNNPSDWWPIYLSTYLHTHCTLISALIEEKILSSLHNMLLIPSLSPPPAAAVCL